MSALRRILGIETSCDESALALVQGEGERVRVVRSEVASQVAIHAQYGGVVPEVAARHHVTVLAGMLRDMGVQTEDVDAVAVTAGPGLVTALRVGIDAARALAWAWQKPLLAVNHMEGHVYSPWLGLAGEVPQFPALCLLVSGGHTELLLMRGHGVYERLGETVDDAVGEAFDKVAKLMGLPYPGGPQISKLAASGKRDAFALPRPMIHEPGYQFSYSGLKTAVRRLVVAGVSAEAQADLAASFEAAAIEPLLAKVERALQAFLDVRSVLLGGGVSANGYLRAGLQRIAAERGVALFLPELRMTGDNAAMIAAAAYFGTLRTGGGSWQGIEPRPDWSLGNVL